MQISNLYLFPSLPNTGSGYEWAVKSDISQLKINANDYAIFYAKKSKIQQDIIGNIGTRNIYYVERKKSTIRFLFCILTLQHPSLFLKLDWRKLPKEVRLKEFDKVFFGDTIFYPVYNSIRHNTTQFRFHNLWSRIFRQAKPSIFDLKNFINMWYFSIIENKILKLNATFLFITDIDRDFAFIDDSKSQYFPINIEIFEEKRTSEIKGVGNNAIIWFGSISTHKYSSVKSFIQIFQKLRKKHKDLIFILYGKGTEEFDDRENGILGLGFYKDLSSLPITSNCIYINPDETGGGIKIKNFDIIKTRNINYLTTPEGFEGCEIYVRDGIKILPIDEWKDYLNNYFN